MAKAIIALGATHATSGKSTVRLPVMMSQPVAPAADITLSASSQVANIAVPDGAPALFWSVSAYGASLRVIFGGPADPTVTNATGWLVSDGETKYFGASATGEKAAVILA